MNRQNILNFYGSKLDLKLDSSELYDYELAKINLDYNSEVLDLSTPITYSTLEIDTTLEDFSCGRSTITLIEFNNTVNDSNYIYSALTATIDYDDFVNTISTGFTHIILNSNIFSYTGLTGETHYFSIVSYNNPLEYDVEFNVDNESELISGFTTTVLKCSERLEDENNCCPIPSKLSNKPWAYQFMEPVISGCTKHIERRTEKGWTLDFIFNREELSWSSGSVFYYLGVRGENDPYKYADNNLSFQFTSDRRIKWVSHHYSGICGTNGFEESFYIASGQTPQLCVTDDTKDFNVTIVFDRYKRYTDCNLENDGGWNDLIPEFITNDYVNTEFTAVTSTQLSIANENEILNKKWSDEKQRRLGILKIYLNGRPIYKLENWEEIIPSERGVQPFIQSWGGGTGLMGGIHEGVSCFNIKSIKYYEEPLDFVHVRHNFITRLNNYDFEICGLDCKDELIGYFENGILDESDGYLLTEDNNVIIY